MSKVVDQAWAKRYSENQSPLLLIHQKFNENLEKTKNGKVEFQKKLSSYGSNLERIRAVQKLYDDECFLFNTNGSDIQNYQKSKSIATEFRQRGNEFYKIRDYNQAIIAYNMALSFSPPTEELALMFGNRSAVFVEMLKPVLALQDINRFFSHSYPEHLKSKLLERKCKCMKMLKLDETMEAENETLDKLITTLITENAMILDDETERRNMYCRLNLFKLKCRNPLVLSAEDFVQIENNDERGRHLVVTKTVLPGTLLIVDQPFAKILLKEVTWDLEHCNYCHQTNCESGIPCQHCVFAFYCNKECLEEAWKKFHQYECQCTPYLHILKPPRTVLLAFRIICTLGPEKLQSLFNSRGVTSLNESKSKILGSNEDNIYNSESYLPIMNLISHPNQHDSTEMISYCLTSLSLLSILENNSSFFNLNYTKEFLKNEFQAFVASLILLHIQNLPCNAHSLNEFKGLNDNNKKVLLPDDIQNASCMEYGAGAFALLSLINHSCDPNVYRLNLYSGHTAVLTIRGLKPGEEILDNYGSHYAIDKIEVRKKHLENNYGFKCNCIACSNNWPLLPELKEWSETFVCSKCSNSFKLFEKYEREYIEKCIFRNNRQSHCQLCGTKYEIPTTRVINLNIMVDQFYNAYNKVLQNQPLEVLDKLTECLTYFEGNLLPPFIRINDTQETLKQALNLIVHFSNFHI